MFIFRYESIITHLIKFPAVFRLSPCHIKMTQAFWQLDHGDFTVNLNTYGKLQYNYKLIHFIIF